MRRFLLAAFLLTPLAASAYDSCAYQAPRHLALDLAGVRALRIEVNSYELHLTGSDAARGLKLDGRACASSAELLEGLDVQQRREGDRLVLELGGGRPGMHFFQSGSRDLEVNVQVPAALPVTVAVGSGDATASGLQRLEAQVGSGDLHASAIGELQTGVGSGSVQARDLGSLQVGAVGSGDFSAEDVRGEAKVGSIGSGEVKLARVGGGVRVDTLGSGDLEVRDVRGDFSLGAKGSGDVSHSGVGGRVDVPHDDDD
jgi:hypothetical protein